MNGMRQPCRAWAYLESKPGDCGNPSTCWVQGDPYPGMLGRDGKIYCCAVCIEEWIRESNGKWDYENWGPF
jgi:hypothetical protein